MDDFEWNVVNEGHLLDAMVGHKPVGMYLLNRVLRRTHIFFFRCK